MNRRRTDADAAPVTDAGACREAALRLLERARRPRRDLERRLRDKGFAAPTVAATLDRLAEVGLVDDVEYARAFLAGRWGRRAAGWARLRQDLRARGVPDEAILSARERFEAESGGADELAAARRALAQAAPRYAAVEPRARQRRLYALLARRGFDADTIRRALALPEETAEA